MLLLVFMAILVSLSDLFSPDAKANQVDINEGGRTPTYVAVLYGLMFPVFATFFTLIVRYVNKTLRLDSDDWMQGYNLIFGAVCTFIGIASWLTHEETFSWTYLY